MIKNHLTLFAILIGIIIHSKNTYSKLTEQCLLGIPIYTKPIVKDNLNNLPIYINAKKMTSNNTNVIEYEGNVDIQQGNHTINANKVLLTKEKTTNRKILRKITATGNVSYDNSQIILTGSKAWFDFNNQNIDVEKGEYLMIGRQGRGYADKIKLRMKNRYTILEKGMFTTCLPGNNSWSIIGSKFVLDREEQLTKIWNAYFRIANVPIFYIPYLQLPTGTTKHSGFLLPNGSYSRGVGLNFILPFYWKIKPNYDLTITPQFMTFRGIKLNNEFRYITPAGDGIVSIDWLPRDRSYIKNKKNGKYPNRESNGRWLLYWYHSGILNQIWCFDIDYTKVSDSKYFTDFASKYGKSTDGYITQKFSFGYDKANLNISLTYKQFQLFVHSLNNKNKNYKIEPQLDINYYNNNLNLFNFNTYIQAMRIISIKSTNPNVTRLHVEPEFNLPLSNGWININNKIKVMATYYNQNIDNTIVNSQLKKNVVRILPLISSEIKLLFKRNILMQKYYLQTLKPRIQYLYIPYRDQNNINNYDSSLLHTDYNGLFRHLIYSGLDRIASANQLTTGITMSIYDDSLNEWFNFSIGQKYYFTNSKNKDGFLPFKEKVNNGSLLWVGDIYLRLTNNWLLRGGLQYSRRFNDITMGNILTEYHRGFNKLIQLNYRFVDYNYIKDTIKTQRIFQKEISQIGAIINWPLGCNWDFCASYYHDIYKNQPVSRLIGIQYKTCCWSINIGYERKIVDWQQKTCLSSYDNRWSINVELNGLNNNHHWESKKMLSSGIIPYQGYFE
ncbi:LPS assembly protein LptD [Arsenophonus endosymbiont of Lipoptena cervi]|uniref:LPS assembly protein LptD n=1 Tax=Arsenophonus endosymbiont of Lipoptena cervi TaxID=363258 RepID=UPI00376F0C8E